MKSTRVPYTWHIPSVSGRQSSDALWKETLESSEEFGCALHGHLPYETKSLLGVIKQRDPWS